MTASSELRRDLVTGDWIAVATARAKRPHAFILKDGSVKAEPKSLCPFENPQKSGNAEPLLLYRGLSSVRQLRHGKQKDGWELQVIPNKFPAFTPVGQCPIPYKVGPYEVIDGRGFHEIIITRDHKKHLALFSRHEAENVIRAYQERYAALKNDSCVTYISIFHNHGKEAGASLVHPHSQLIAIPIVPTNVWRSISHSATYFRENKSCVHCEMIKWELKDKERIVFENEAFVAFCPFVSRTAFEIRIFPKKHVSHFDHFSSDHHGALADALRYSLKTLHKTLRNPPYNFFIHTAPVDHQEYPHYHWHIEILPKTSIWAGFELGTGIEISTIKPENAAEFLRRALKGEQGK